MTAAIDTRAYRRSHGKAPRPAQYGLWGFTADACGLTLWITGTYAEAVRQLPAGPRWTVLP